MQCSKYLKYKRYVEKFDMFTFYSNFIQTLIYFIDQIKSIYYFEIILTLKDSTNIRDMVNIMWQKKFNKIFWQYKNLQNSKYLSRKKIRISASSDLSNLSNCIDSILLEKQKKL